MKIELRKRLKEDHVTYEFALILIPTKRESKTIDKVFGSKVGKDGLISNVKGKVKLSDGVYEHYIILERDA